MTKVNLNVS